MKPKSKETRRKMSRAKMGDKNPRAMLGRRHTKETRELMSKLKKEYYKTHPISEETKRKMSETKLKYFRENPISKETKKKQSEIRKEWHRTHTTGKFYTYKRKTLNIKEWAKELNIPYGALKYRLGKKGMDFKTAIKI